MIRRVMHSPVAMLLPDAIVALALAGCAGALASSAPQAEAAGLGTYVYTCSDGPRFSARFRGDSAVVELPTRAPTLPRVVSASGAKYEADGVVLWTRGEQASLEVGTTAYGECEGIRVGTPSEEARLLGAEFRAVGQEPGWTLDLDRERWIRFVGDYGRTRFVTPIPEPVRDGTGTVTYRAQTEAHDLTVVIRPTPCQDVMSGERFSHAVAVRLDGRALEGCGRALVAGELAGTRWGLSELGGAPTVEGPSGREAHLRLVAEGSRVTGSTGCNTFGGQYELAGDRVRFSRLVSTRMACLDPAVARQEQEFLRVLDTVDRFTTQADSLTLYAGDRPVARFTAGFVGEAVLP